MPTPTEPMSDDQLVAWFTKEILELLQQVNGLLPHIEDGSQNQRKLRMMDKHLDRLLEDVDWIDEESGVTPPPLRR